MKPETQHKYAERIDQVIKYLNQQVGAMPSLRDLADVAGISPFHFHRVYRAVTGETPFGTIRRLRLARAAVLLQDGGQSITEIAFNVGYESSQAFSKAFRETTGWNASELRKDHVELQAVIDLLSNPPAKPSAAPVAVRVVSVAPFTVLAHRHVGPHDGLFESFGRFFHWVRESGLEEEMRGIYGIPVDDVQTVPERDCRFDCCFDLGPDVSPIPPYRSIALGGGKFAVARHVGPFEGLEDRYDYVYGTWIHSSGYGLRQQPVYNHYLSDPETLPPERWETDIYVPIEFTEAIAE